MVYKCEGGEAEIRQAQSPGVRSRGVMCAELIRGPFIPRESGGDGHWERQIEEKSEIHLKGLPCQGQCTNNHIPRLADRF